MSKLTDSMVRRAGITARHWNIETREIYAAASYSSRKKIALKFEMASKGGGTTAVELMVGTKDFRALPKLMCEVDQIASLKAMSRETAKQITSIKR